MTSQISFRDAEIDTTLPRLDPNRQQGVIKFIPEYLESIPNGAPA